MTVLSISDLKTNMPQGAIRGTSVSDLHNMVDTFEDRTTQEVSVKTANYTAALTDNRRRLVFNSASAVTLTLPNNLPVGWECMVIQSGLGQVTISVTGGALRAYNSHTKTAGQWAQAYLFVLANPGTAPEVAMSGQTAV